METDKAPSGKMAAIGRGMRRYDAALKRRWPRGRWVAHGVTAFVALSFVAAAVNPSRPISSPVASASPVAIAAVATTAPTPRATPTEVLPSAVQATPSVTPAPTPGATPEPTPEPTEEPTPDPTEEPTPDPTPEVTEEPESLLTFEPITLKGRGDKVARFRIPEDAVAMAMIKYTGGGNFVVWTVGSGGSTEDLLVNEIGSYSGRVLFDESSHSVAFKIESSGSWTIVVNPIEKIPVWSGSTTRSATGDQVLKLTGAAADSFVVMKLTHSGSSNFVVWAYGLSSTDLLVNEIGHYSGEVLMNDVILLEIHADGKWTARVE